MYKAGRVEKLLVQRYDDFGIIWGETVGADAEMLGNSYANKKVGVCNKLDGDNG